MSSSSLRAYLDIDADGAYAFLTDLAFLPEWYPSVRRMEVRGGGAPRVGATVLEHRALPALPWPTLGVPMRVVDARPGVRYGVRTELPLVCTIDAAYELEPRGDDETLVRVSYRVEPHGLAAVPASRIVAWTIQLQGRAQVAGMPGGLAAWRGDRHE